MNSTLKGIYPRIDWVTVCFNDCSLLDVYGLFHLQSWATAESARLLANRLLINAGYETKFVMSINGFTIKLPYSEILNKFPEFSQFDESDPDFLPVEPLVFFERKLSCIWVELTGTGLEFLRSEGINIDADLFVPFLLPGNDAFRYHFTRVDFAFDIIDTMPDLVDKTISLLNEFGHKDTGRMTVGEKNSSLKYDVRDVGQKTFYIGGTRSDALLRGYDKNLQFAQGKCVCPFIDTITGYVPSSWLRFELQCRNEKAMELLYNTTGDYFDCMNQIFKFIYQRFVPNVYADKYMLHVVPCKEWQELFDWESIPTLMQKANFIQFREPLDQARSYISGQAFGSLLVYISNFGWKSFRSFVDSTFSDLQFSADKDSPKSRRCLSLINRCYVANGNNKPDHLISSGSMYFLID